MNSDKAATGLTIVVLTYNRRELLRGCLESLFAQEDPGVPLHFIVVDDGSTDGTGEMVRELTFSRPHWQYIRQAHRGIAAARNAGISSSRSTWIAIVADDYLLPADYAQAIAVFFKDHPQARVLRFQVVGEGSGFLSRALHAYQEASVIRRSAPQGSGAKLTSLWRRPQASGMITTDHDLEAAGAAAFCREVFQDIGNFDESFIRGEDTDFTRRLRAAGILVHYSPGLHIRHRNDPSMTAALKNAFINGKASWRLYAAPASKPASIARIVLLALRSGPAALYWSCWRSWVTGWPVRFFVYWPVLLLLETSSRAGFFCGSVHSRKKSPAVFCGHQPK
jgi:GT2 family glycosyltransferase